MSPPASCALPVAAAGPVGQPTLIRCLHVVGGDRRWPGALLAMLERDLELDVLQHSSTHELIEALDDSPPAIALIDDTPDGRVALAALGARPDRFATVLLTTGTEVRRAVEAMKAGAHDVLDMPVSAERLRAAVTGARLYLDAHRLRRRNAEAAQMRVSLLTPRERDVLAALVDGSSNKATAQALALSSRTVEIHRARMMTKLGARNLSQVLRVAFDAGL